MYYRNLFYSSLMWALVVIGFIAIFLLLSFNHVYAATLTSGMNATAVIGAGSPDDFAVTTGGVTSSRVAGVFDVYVDVTNNYLFTVELGPANGGANRVLVWELDSEHNLLDYDADYVLGQTNFTSNDFGVTNATFDGVRAITADEDNMRLFVADENNNRVLMFDYSSGFTTGMAATQVLGQANFTSSVSATTQNGMQGPNGLVYDAGNERLFVTDAFGERILVFNTSDGVTTQENAAYVLGQPNFTTAGESTTQNTISGAAGLAYDSDNEHLYVADATDNRVMVWDLSSSISNGKNADYVIGQPDFTTNTDQGTTSDSVDGAMDVSVDTTNNRLFVSDGNTNRVLVFDISSGPSINMTASYALGQVDFTTSSANQGGGAAANTMNYATGVHVNGVDNMLYVADTANSRILIFNLTTTSLTYTSGFTESSSNDGSLDGSRIATISDDTFVNSGSTLTLDTHYSLTNTPAGLTPVMTVNARGTTATLTFTGTATSHESANDVSNLTITFLDGAFTNTPTASDATGYTDTTGTISFDDAPVESSPRRSSSTPQSRAKAQEAFAEYYGTATEETTSSSNNSPTEILNSGQCPVELIISDNMKQGDRDGQYSSYNNGNVTEVHLLQAHINRILAHYYNQAAGPVDGIYGPLTKRGVERLQQTLQDEQGANLGPAGIDGIVGPMTRAAINGSCGGEMTE